MFSWNSVFFLTKQHCRWKLRTTGCSRTLTGRFGKHGPSYLWSQNSIATRILNPAHSFTLYAFYLWSLEKIPCYTKCFLKNMILGTNKYTYSKKKWTMAFWSSLFVISIKNWMGTLPTDPKFARATRMRYSGFFWGPWNVGPVGDFLDYCIAIFFWWCRILWQWSVKLTTKLGVEDGSLGLIHPEKEVSSLCKNSSEVVQIHPDVICVHMFR